MGEASADRAELLRTLANLPAHPESVPINQLVRVPGTPLAHGPDVDPFDFVRTVAVARLLMPRAHVRLSAGREGMSDELQALCFLAGANSIFHGEKLLTTGNPDIERDRRLFARLGLPRHPGPAAAMSACAARTGAGSGASHLVTGHGVEHQRLEEELAAFTGRERALLFSTGYMANLAVMSALAGRGERVLLDRLSHASLIDGALLSGARLRRYRHADGQSAARLFGADAPLTALIATDGVFSMDGDLVPRPEVARAAHAHQA